MISHGCSISLSHTTHKLGLYFLLISILYIYQEAWSFVIMGHGTTWESEKANLFYLFFYGIWRYAIMGFMAFHPSTVVDTDTHTHLLLLHITTLLLLLSHPLLGRHYSYST